MLCVSILRFGVILQTVSFLPLFPERCLVKRLLFDMAVFGLTLTLVSPSTTTLILLGLMLKLRSITTVLGESLPTLKFLMILI